MLLTPVPPHCLYTMFACFRPRRRHVYTLCKKKESEPVPQQEESRADLGSKFFMNGNFCSVSAPVWCSANWASALAVKRRNNLYIYVYRKKNKTVNIWPQPQEEAVKRLLLVHAKCTRSCRLYCCTGKIFCSNIDVSFLHKKIPLA